jgi:polysaccharide pyruvyl transferase WcaK-like protein
MKSQCHNPQTRSDRLIFLQAKTQFENIGDLIINKSLLEELRKFGQIIANDTAMPDSYLLAMGLREDERISKYRYRSFGLFVVMRCLANFVKPQKEIFLITLPGHYYGDTIRMAAKGYITAAVFRLLSILHCRVCKIANSLGPFSKHVASAERFRARQMYFYSVRDSLSKNIAEQMGFPRIYLFPDLAWLLDAGIPSPANINNPEVRDYVVFSFREHTHELIKDRVYSESVKEICARIAALVQGAWGKHIIITHQVDRDAQFCSEIYDYLQQRSFDVSIRRELLNHNDIEQLYSQAYMVFSNRLHVLLLSAIYSSLPIAVIDKTNHLKILGIFLDNNIERLICDVSQKTESLREQLGSLQNDYLLWQRRLGEIADSNKRQGRLLFQRIFS